MKTFKLGDLVKITKTVKEHTFKHTKDRAFGPVIIMDIGDIVEVQTEWLSYGEAQLYYVWFPRLGVFTVISAKDGDVINYV